MQVDHVGLSLRVTLPEQLLQQTTSASPEKVAEQLATAIDRCSRQQKLGYYPAIEYLRQVADADAGLVDTAEQLAWDVSKAVRREVQTRLRPIFSSVKFQSIQTTAFALPPVRPTQPAAFDRLVQHFTVDTVKLELVVTLLRKDADQRGAAAEAYARKMIYRWLKGVFVKVELTASVALDR